MKKSALMLTNDREIDRRIIQEADSLERNGWKVTIVAMPRFKDEGEKEDPRVVRISSQESSSNKAPTLVIKAYKGLSKKLRISESFRIFLRKFFWGYICDPEAFYTKLFEETALKYKASVVVAHDLPMLPIAYSVANKFGAKLVYDSHELFAEQELSLREKRVWKKVEQKYISYCDEIITVNPMIAQELESRYECKKNVHVIYNALEECFVANSRIFHERFSLSSDKKVLLYQGGLTAHRNLEALVESMRHIEDPSIVLVILGNGPLDRKLKKKVRDLKLEGKVYFHEAVSQEELLNYTASADLGIIPYQYTCLNNYYCTPNKLFEFIQAGLPILASDLPAIRNIVETHKVGSIGNLNAAHQIAESVSKLFKDQKQLERYSSNAVKARSKLKWQEAELVSIFEGQI